MIRVNRYLYVNILTAALFAVCAVNRSLGLMCVTYAVMLLHEAAHTLAAVCIGLGISHITLQPFGVNLKLKNKIVYCLADEIILYISGPLCNVVLAFASAFVYNQYPCEKLRLFYIANIMLFLMNMLPALPLDGGIILKKIMMRCFGYSAARKIMIVISAFVSAAVMTAGVYVLAKTRFNFSLLIFSFLLLGNAFTQKEKYDTDFVKKLMFHPKKNPKKVYHALAGENESYAAMVKKFRQGRYNVIYVTGSDGKIKKTLTETEIINALTETNVTV